MNIYQNTPARGFEHLGGLHANPESVIPWPQKPHVPALGQPLILRIPTDRVREIARKQVRKVLREVLSSWCELPSDSLPLKETLRGPCWTGELCGSVLDISLSYAVDEAWIGLIIGGHVGVDVMAVEEVPEMENVARIFLDPEVATRVLSAHNPPIAFASAWTEREAKLKCLKAGLIEWSPAQGIIENKCSCRKLIISDCLLGSIATICSPPADSPVTLGDTYRKFSFSAL